MDSATSSKSVSIAANNKEGPKETKTVPPEKDTSTSGDGHSSNDPTILIVDPISFTIDQDISLHEEGRPTSFNFVSVKKEDVDIESIEVISDDSSCITELVAVKVEPVDNTERHFVKMEDPVLFESDLEDDDESDGESEISGFSNEVRIIDTQAEQVVKPSISVKKHSFLKASQIPADGSDTIYNESFSNAVVRAPKQEISDESDDCQYIEEVGENEISVNESILGKSSFLTALKDNLKRKSESVQDANVKKQKTVGSDVSISVPGSTQAVPGLSKLRNIIGSNFKKLNLNLREPADVKAELGLSYKHEDPLVEEVVSKQNADGSGYTCPKCKANFKWKTTLKFHMFNHLEDKAHECNVCFKLFLSSSYLNEHKKSHHSESYERIFRCPECSGQFENETSLTCHMITHAKPESYVCHVCREKFTSLYSLNSHKAKHSSAIKYECKPCDLRFKTLKTLTKHIATHDVQNKGQKNKN